MIPANKSYRPGDLMWCESAVVYALHVEALPIYCCGCLLPATQQKLVRCSKCKQVFYCSRRCQKSHWPYHKRECACFISSGTIPGATTRIIFNILASKVRFLHSQLFSSPRSVRQILFLVHLCLVSLSLR